MQESPGQAIIYDYWAGSFVDFHSTPGPGPPGPHGPPGLPTPGPPVQRPGNANGLHTNAPQQSLSFSH